jgi:sigma-B regulation protein RsbU (phosphoserine phosphatase)
MASRRPSDTPPPARRRQAQASLQPPVDDPNRTARDLLLHSWPGRLFIVATAFKLVISVFRFAGDLPVFLRAINTATTIALAFSVLFFVTRLVFLVQRRLLWRVRRKLILSYIFLGVVPSILIFGFFLLGSTFVSWSVGAYLFRDGYAEVTRNVELMAEAAALEITRDPRTTEQTINRVQGNGSKSLGYPALSMMYAPATTDRALVSRGPWEHLRPLTPPLPTLPTWVKNSPKGVTLTTAITPSDSPDEYELIIRAVRPTGPPRVPTGWVVVDQPLDGAMLNVLYERTGVKAGAVSLTRSEPTNTLPITSNDTDSTKNGWLTFFGRTLTIFDTIDWQTGNVRRASVALSFRAGELYNKLSQAQSFHVGNYSWGQMITVVLVIVAVLFLIIELAALVMGLALARSITSSIHELFMGTERVRQGDFTHRININTQDQLGELATSFNQMTGSIENLLQTAAEKKRMEEELRIARQIQMSLLPRGPLDMPGLGVTALCVPAREVGGDYYDFFPLGEQRVGVLIADVSGKGTSAALYMAELKGLMLSLSQIYQSPRQLLIEANRILAENLDSRSFITMTYAVLDLAIGEMTYARAGHTPLIYLPGPGSLTPGAQVLVPSGMVVGLRIDGAAAKFDELLEEKRIPLDVGDVIVLYTDGITEAMNPASDLFGEARLSRIVEEHGHLESGELRERILREIEAFVGSADQHDDMTMILIKVEQAVATAGAGRELAGVDRR